MLGQNYCFATACAEQSRN